MAYPNKQDDTAPEKEQEVVAVYHGMPIQQQQQVMYQDKPQAQFQQIQSNQGMKGASQGNPYPTGAQAVSAEIDGSQSQQERRKRSFKEGAGGLFVCRPGLSHKSDRAKFAIKVYAIVLAMLTVTTLGVIITRLSPPLYNFLQQNPWLMYVALVVGVLCSIVIVCTKKFLYKVPYNYLMLLLYTLIWTCMVMTFTTYFNIESVLIATCMVYFMVIGLTFLALLVKDDMFWCYGLAATFIMSSFPVIVFSVWNISMTPRTPNEFWIRIGLGYLISLIFSIYIIYDVDVIFNRLSKDDYIIGALLLYTDIIQLFLWILSCFGGSN